MNYRNFFLLFFFIPCTTFCSQPLVPNMPAFQELFAHNQQAALFYLQTLPRDLQKLLIHYIYRDEILTAAMKMQVLIPNEPSFQAVVPLEHQNLELELADILTATLSSDGQSIITLNRIGRVQIFNRTTGALINHFPIQNFDAHGFKRIYAEGRYLIIEKTHHHLPQFIICDIEQAEAQIWGTTQSKPTFNHNRTLFASILNNRLRVTNLANQALDYALDNTAVAYQFSQDPRFLNNGDRASELLIFVTPRGEFKAWSLAERKIVYQSQIPLAAQVYNKKVQISNTHTFIAHTDLYADRNTLTLWNIRENRFINLRAESHRPITQFFFSPRDKYITALCHNNLQINDISQIFIWEAATGRLVRTLTHRFTQSNHSHFNLSYNEDENLLIAHPINDQVAIWNLATGKCIHTRHARLLFNDYDHKRTFVSGNNGRVYVKELYAPEILEQLETLDIAQTILLADALKAAGQEQPVPLDLTLVPQSRQIFDNMPELVRTFILTNTRVLRTQEDKNRYQREQLVRPFQNAAHAADHALQSDFPLRVVAALAYTYAIYYIARKLFFHSAKKPAPLATEIAQKSSPQPVKGEDKAHVKIS